MLRSEAFNEAFDDFEDAFLKALASSNPLVFDLHQKVMANLREFTESEAIAELKDATHRFFIHAVHAIDQQIIMTAETDRLVNLSKVDPHAIKDAVLRQRQRALDCIVRQKDDTW
jgi:microcystin degradation protein MlrC